MYKIRLPKFATNEARVANQDELDAIIGRWTRARRRYHIMRQCQAQGIIAAVVQSAEDRVEYDPQLQHRAMHPIINHPELGDLAYEGYPVKMSRTPAFVHGRAPTLAEHNDYVYGELLGMSEAQIAGAMRALFFREGWVAEGAGAVGIAPLLEPGLVELGKNIAVVISGRNIDMDAFCAIVGAAAPTEEAHRA